MFTSTLERERNMANAKQKEIVVNVSKAVRKDFVMPEDLGNDIQAVCRLDSKVRDMWVKVAKKAIAKGIDYRWIPEKLRVGGKMIENKDHHRPDVFAAFQEKIVSALSDERRKMFEADRDSLNDVEKKVQDEVRNLVDRQRNTIVRHMEKQVALAAGEKKEKDLLPLSAAVVDKIAAIKDYVIEFKSKTRQDVRKADLLDKLSATITEVNKLQKIVQ